MKQDNSTTVQLRGNPSQLSTIIHLPREASSYKASSGRASSRLSSCSVNLPGVDVKRASIREIDSAAPGVSLLRIKLPISTPPGVYKGMIQVGDEEFPIEVDVEPRPRLRLFPRSLKSGAAPGSVVSTNLTVLNTGNFVVNLQEEYRFCVFELGGIDRAFFLALASDQTTGERRIDRLANELAASHGGRVRLKIESGSGAIAPGEVRELRIAMRLSDRLRPGQTYSGTWKVENTSLAIELRVSDKIQEAPK